MAFAAVTDIVQLTIAGDAFLGGFMEKHWLPYDDAQNYVTTAKTILAYRLLFMPKTMEVAYAKVTNYGQARKATNLFRASRALSPIFPLKGVYPIGVATPDDDVTNPNDSDAALELRKETAEGAFAQMFLHGVPDVEELGDILTSGVTIPGALPAAPTTFYDPTQDPVVAVTTAYGVLIGNYLRYLQEKTVFLRKRVVAGNLVMSSAPIDKITFRRMHSKHVGAFFGQQRGRARTR